MTDKSWEVQFLAHSTTDSRVSQPQKSNECMLCVCQVTIDIELWDSAASGGVGRKLAHASVDLDLHAFEPFKAQSASVELFGRESKVQP